MKKKLTFKAIITLTIIVVSAAFGFTESFAQDTSTSGSSELAIGAKVGVNFNQFSQPGTTVGGSAGGFVRYQVLDFLQVQGELIYSLQGGGRMDYTRSYYITNVDGPISYVRYVNRSILLHVVEVPISARLTLPELNGGMIIPRLIIGGSYSYNFIAMEDNDKIIGFTDGTTGLVSNSVDNVTDNYFPHNYNVHLGIALDFNLSEENVFTMEFRYRRGFSNLNQTETFITELTDKLYSSGFSINFAYQIF